MTNTTSTTARRPRGEYAKSAATKAVILDAALEVFAQSGYRAGSLREVAERAGMSEAGLLHHFPNKSALLQSVLDHRDERARAVVDFEHADGRFGLRGFVELARRNAAAPGVVELYCTLSAEATSPDHPAHEYFVGRYRWVREATLGCFERLREAGRLRPGVDPWRAAITTVALMDGLQVQWLLNRDIVDMADELAALFESFVDFGGSLESFDQVPAEVEETAS